jgi:UDP-N-acetylglucosamine 2-epimerase
VEIRANQVVGTDTQRILDAFKKVMNSQNLNAGVPTLWDGRAAERIVKILLDKI